MGAQQWCLELNSYESQNHTQASLKVCLPVSPRVEASDAMSWEHSRIILGTPCNIATDGDHYKTTPNVNWLWDSETKGFIYNRVLHLNFKEQHGRGMESLDEPEDQEVSWATVSPRNNREVVSMKHQ